jgi:hypothetical protein
MSFDLAVWYSSTPQTNDRALWIYQALCDGDCSVVEPQASVAAFLRELSAQYPDIDTVPEDEIDISPWTCCFDVSDGHVIMPISWGRVEEVAPIVVELAAKHGLVCYNPQGRQVFLPALHCRDGKRATMQIEGYRA